jgi:hypothetical protein
MRVPDRTSAQKLYCSIAHAAAAVTVTNTVTHECDCETETETESETESKKDSDSLLCINILPTFQTSAEALL